MLPPKRILFVDDQEDICEMMKVFLNSTGCQVETAKTWEEALRLAREEEFDLYILDLKFPSGSGLELCRKIRKFDSETPIIFYSAYTAQIMQMMVKAVGAQASIEKTAPFEKLQEMVSQLTSGAEGKGAGADH
jgi:DNA-binding response OmpR family regulator